MKEIEVKGAKRGQRRYRWESLEVGDVVIGHRTGLAGYFKERSEEAGLNWDFSQKRLGPRKYQIKRIK